MKSRLLLALSVLVPSIHPAMTQAQWAADGVVLSAGVGNQTGPRAIPDGAGGAFVTWTDSRIGHLDIYAQRVDATGEVQWTPNGDPVRAVALNQSDPGIVSDGAGGAIIVWVEQRNNGVTDIYAQRIDGSGTPQWTVVEVCGAQHDQDDPSIVSDGAGGAIVTWKDARDGDNMKTDIYARRINSAGVAQWTSDGVAICTAANAQNFPTITTDGAGGAIITWSDNRTDGVTLDIYARRINFAGTVQWTGDGVAICTEANNQDAPAIATDGAGGAIITWFDARDGLTDIYAQRVNGSGAVQWDGDGIVICAATNSQYDPQIAFVGAGGAMVTWNDSRDVGTTDVDIYAQRVNGSGAVQWTADGVALCTAAGSQVFARVTADGAGGAVVAWEDTRSGGLNYDIYAQRINASGAVQWTGDGVALCTASNGQIDPTIVPDGVGGAIVAWGDVRNGATYDIYGNRVTPGGAIPTAVGGTPVAFSMVLGDNYPNPFAAGTTVDLALPREADVSVEVFDVTGRRVRAINLGRVAAGATRLAFDGRDDQARVLPSGVYFCRVRAANEAITRKMLIQR